MNKRFKSMKVDYRETRYKKSFIKKYGASFKYADWLRLQPNAIIKSVLSKVSAKIFIKYRRYQSSSDLWLSSHRALKV
jgi:hypothetical protein